MLCGPNLRIEATVMLMLHVPRRRINPSDRPPRWLFVITLDHSSVRHSCEGACLPEATAVDDVIFILFLQ